METNTITYPYIVFKLKGRLFCISSKYVDTILQLPEYTPLPNSPADVKGIFPYRGGMVAIHDLRMAFGITSMQEEYEAFADMLEERKQDHVRWVEELERSVEENREFTLAKDPHQCAFGKWYDQFTCDNHEVMFHLKKIDQPHRELHHASTVVHNEGEDCCGGDCSCEEEAQIVLKRLREVQMPQILTLLDEAKEIFRSTIFHEMALVLTGDCGACVSVDEVLSVDMLSEADGKETESITLPSMIRSVMHCEKDRNLILEVDGEWLRQKVQ